MIVVDTSALGSLFLSDPSQSRVETRLSRAEAVLIPVSCIVEFAALRRFGERRFEWLDRLVQGLGAEIVGIDAGASEIAVEAVRRYGRGSTHPAQLNFGDCLTYAVAKHRDLPLLFVGDDFRHTDIRPA